MGVNVNLKKKNTKNKTKQKRRPNWLLRFTLIVFAIPVLIVGWILLTSLEKSGEPVFGDRFANQLDPAIKDKQIKEIEAALKVDQVQKVEVNLKSATLRISIDANDELNNEQLYAIGLASYESVRQVLPIETYFTNKDGMKMYDLEITVYNFIPTEENKGSTIRYVGTKNAAAEAVNWANPTSPKNPELSESILKNPKKGEKVGQ